MKNPLEQFVREKDEEVLRKCCQGQQESCTLNRCVFLKVKSDSTLWDTGDDQGPCRCFTFHLLPTVKGYWNTPFNVDLSLFRNIVWEPAILQLLSLIKVEVNLPLMSFQLPWICISRCVPVSLAVLWSCCPKVSALSGSLSNLRALLMDEPKVKLSQDGSAVLLNYQEEGTIISLLLKCRVECQH